VERGVLLAAKQISVELEAQIPHAIFMMHVLLILKVIFGYALCFGWVAYSSLRQIRIHSAHSSISKF